MLRPGVEVHVATQLIQLLPSGGVGVRVEAPLIALLHQDQAARGREPEDATLLAPACERCVWRGHEWRRVRADEGRP